MVNKQGQTRLAQYYEPLPHAERRALEGEIVRKCLSRSDAQVRPLGNKAKHRLCHSTPMLEPSTAAFCFCAHISRLLTSSATRVRSLCAQCSFVEHRNFKIVYRRYASLFFLVGVDAEEVRFFLSRCATTPAPPAVFLERVVSAT